MKEKNKASKEQKSSGKIEKAIEFLKLHGDQLNSFLFGTPFSEMMEKGIKTLFPSYGEDIRQKTELNARDVRACLFLKLAGAWVSNPFDNVAEMFMNLQISKGRMGRTELATILMVSNLLENLPKEAVSKLFMKTESTQGVSSIEQKK